MCIVYVVWVCVDVDWWIEVGVMKYDVGVGCSWV